MTSIVSSPVVSTTKPSQNQGLLQWLHQGISNLASLPQTQNYGLLYTPYGYNVYPTVQSQASTPANVNNPTNTNTNTKPNNLVNSFSSSLSSFPSLSSGSNSLYKNLNASPFTSILSQASNFQNNLRGK